MSKLLVKKSERNLLLVSEALKDFPKAYDFIREHPNIKDDNLSELPLGIQEFFSNLFERVKKNAIEEWSANSKDAIYELEDDERIKCNLCGTEIKYVCEISNKISNKILVVGTECVKKFGIYTAVHIDKVLKEKRQIKKYEYMVKFYPNIEQDIQFWNDELEEYSKKHNIIILDKYEYPYTELGGILKALYAEYLKDTDTSIIKSKSYVEKIRSIYEKRSDYMRDINIYANQNKNKDFIATKKIEDWLISNDKRETLNYIKKNGIIDWRAAIQIQEPELASKFIKIFNIYFKKQNLNLKIHRLVPQKGLEVEVFYKYKVHLLLNYKDFMMFNGGVLFEQENLEQIDLVNIIRNNSIIGEDSLYLTISLINDISKKQGVYIKELDDDIDFPNGDMFVYLKEENCFVMPKIKEVTTRYKDLAFGLGTNSINSYIKFLKRHKRVHKEDVREIKENRKRMIY